MRLPNSFITPLVGRRNVVYTSILLTIPCLWTELAPTNKHISAMVVVLAVMMSGVGGGTFSSSMANINPFYQRKSAGYALGMNGALGNLGVSLCQLLLGNVHLTYSLTHLLTYLLTYLGVPLCPLLLGNALMAFGARTHDRL